jgi:hypothetical protein
MNLALAFFASQLLTPLAALPAEDEHTIALWLFDEPDYPNMTLTDASRHQFDLRLKSSGRLVPGKFGNALELGPAPGVAAEYACASDVLYREPAATRLQPAFVPEMFNVGYLDWTLEFWFKPAGAQATRGVVFELAALSTGLIPGIANSLLLEAGGKQFVLRSPEQRARAVAGAVNEAGGITPADKIQPAGFELVIPTDEAAMTGAKEGWHHVAFAFTARERQMRHYVDGRLQSLPAKGGFLPMKGKLKALTIGSGNDGKLPLAGRLDEMRWSSIARYAADFTPPGSFSRNYGDAPPAAAKPAGAPLLFGNGAPKLPVKLGSRKHVFIDDALLESKENVRFVVNPPVAREVTDFRIDRPWEPQARFGPGVPDVLYVDDEGEQFRMAYTNAGMWSGKRDAICIATSKDGLHWIKPNLGIIEWDGSRENNIVLTEATQGTMFRDPNPNVPPGQRYKYIAYQMQRGIYVYVSPDGIHWRRNETIALPFDCGGGVETFWDDQRGLYATFIRHEGKWTDLKRGPGRACVLAETREILKPWLFKPCSPPGFRVGVYSLPSVTDELPIAIGPNEHGQIYRCKPIKYAGAPDAYVGFAWRLQTGNIRPGSELMVSRDGAHWKGCGAPFYFTPEFKIEGRQVIEALMDHGMAIRGEEVIQFATARFTAHGGAAYGGEEYEGGIYDRFLRLKQRLDGFVSLDADDTKATAMTKPLVFEGQRLVLNVSAKGSMRVGILDETGKPLPGFSLSDCDPIRADSVRQAVTWRGKSNVAALSGKPVRLQFEMQQTKLYALQFTP